MVVPAALRPLLWRRSRAGAGLDAVGVAAAAEAEVAQRLLKHRLRLRLRPTQPRLPRPKRVSRPPPVLRGRRRRAQLLPLLPRQLQSASKMCLIGASRRRRCAPSHASPARTLGDASGDATWRKQARAPGHRL